MFRCQDAKSGKWQLRKLPPLTFIHRFLQHVLPKGFQKVRYYGLLSPKKKPLRAVARYILRADTSQEKSPPPGKPKPCCPKCGSTLLLVGRIGPASYQQARAIPQGRAPPV
ncbi:MAG: transposase [Desulfobulbaceae bacterium]